MFWFEHERKTFHNNKRKDGLTVFIELNTGGERCKKDKLSSLWDASSVFYFYFALCRYPKYTKKKGRACVLIWTRAENFSKNSEEKGSSSLNWSRSNLLNIIKIKKERNWTHPKSSGKKIVGLASIAHCTQLLFSLCFLTGLVSFWL